MLDLDDLGLVHALHHWVLARRDALSVVESIPAASTLTLVVSSPLGTARTDALSAHLAPVLHEAERLRRTGQPVAGGDPAASGAGTVAASTGPPISPLVSPRVSDRTTHRSAPTEGSAPDGEPTTHVIDTVYDGPDLADVAELTGHSIEEVIARHHDREYTVAFVGFSRGFPYFAGLDPTLLVPRLTTPRTLVPAGSVGMGAGFTGIYPAGTPGGWRLLGRTDVVCFDERATPPARFAPGRCR
jgi:hypothetical protein